MVGNNLNGGLGNVIIVHHHIQKDNKWYDLNIASVYAHLSEIANTDFASEVVEQEYIIGKEGGTGKKDGDSYPFHLHLELWKLSPVAQINLQNVRKIRSPALSYNYRYINDEFASFLDTTGTSGFNVKSTVKQSYASNTYTIIPTTFGKVTYINKIKEYSKFFILNTTDTGVSNIKNNDQKLKQLIFERKTLINNVSKQYVTTSQANIKYLEFLKTFRIEEIKEIDSKTSASDFLFDFNNYKGAIKDFRDSSTTDNEFGNNLKEIDNIPLFTFYFPLRLNIFNNNYNNKSNKFDYLYENTKSITNSDNNFFLRLKINNLQVGKILNIKYEKDRSFNSSIPSFSSLISPDDVRDYTVDIIRFKEDKIEEVTQNSLYSFILLDETERKVIEDKAVSIFNLIKFFDFKYSIDQKQLKIELIPNKFQIAGLIYKEAKDGVETLTKTLINHFKIYFSTEDLSNNPFSNAFKKFFSNVKEEPGSGIPDVVFSTSFESLSTLDYVIPTNEKIENIHTDSYSVENKLAVPNDTQYFDLQSTSLVDCMPFAESCLFSHKISSTYLPTCIYNIKFYKSKKVQGSTFPVLPNTYYVPGPPNIIKDKVKEKYYSAEKYQSSISLYSTRNSDDIFTNDDQNDKDKAFPLYVFYLNLDDLYYETIDNMINIEVYNIEDQS